MGIFATMKSVLGRTRKADVTFRSDGRVDIASRVARMLKLQVGDVMDVAIGDGEVVLYRRLKAEDTVGRHEACCYSANGTGWCMRFHSKRLTDVILKMVGEESSAAVSAGEEIDIDGRPGVCLIVRKEIKG